MSEIPESVHYTEVPEDASRVKMVQKMYLNIISKQINENSRPLIRPELFRKPADPPAFRMAIEFVSNYLAEHELRNSLDCAVYESNGLLKVDRHLNKYLARNLQLDYEYPLIPQLLGIRRERMSESGTYSEVVYGRQTRTRGGRRGRSEAELIQSTDGSEFETQSIIAEDAARFGRMGKGSNGAKGSKGSRGHSHGKVRRPKTARDRYVLPVEVEEGDETFTGLGEEPEEANVWEAAYGLDAEKRARLEAKIAKAAERRSKHGSRRLRREASEPSYYSGYSYGYSGSYASYTYTATETETATATATNTVTATNTERETEKGRSSHRHSRSGRSRGSTAVDTRATSANGASYYTAGTGYTGYTGYSAAGAGRGESGSYSSYASYSTAGASESTAFVPRGAQPLDESQLSRTWAELGRADSESEMKSTRCRFAAMVAEAASPRGSASSRGGFANSNSKSNPNPYLNANIGREREMNGNGNGRGSGAGAGQMLPPSSAGRYNFLAKFNEDEDGGNNGGTTDILRGYAAGAGTGTGGGGELFGRGGFSMPAQRAAGAEPRRGGREENVVIENIVEEEDLWED